MRYKFFLPIAYCLLPLASCLPLLGGVRGGFLLPLAFPSWEGLGVGSSCLLSAPCSLKPRILHLISFIIAIANCDYSRAIANQHL
ncbi:hypothetical protein [Moorena producens]|uniref:hypothetical protein n=1 Tax=Moorena producens TaxID=1155739 RepID=UPI003C78FF6A